MAGAELGESTSSIPLDRDFHITLSALSTTSQDNQNGILCHPGSKVKIIFQLNCGD